MQASEAKLNVAAYLLALLGVTLPLISIALAQIFLALAIPVFVLEQLSSKRSKISFPPIKGPLLLFMASTALALALSPEPAVGWAPINKLWLFAIVVLVPNLFDLERLGRAFRLLFTLGVLASLLVVAQFLIVRQVSVETRLTGFMSHWMTLSGELMLAFTASFGFFLFAKPERAWLWLTGLASMVVALSMTLTRSVWLATLTGALLLLLMRHFHWKTAAVACLACGLFLATAPSVVQRRIQSMWDTNDPSNYARLAIWTVGLRMVQAHPWTGVGPQRISKVFYDYHPHPEDRRRSGFYPVHMHNNLLQFAAERGIPCALFWLWLMLKLGLDHWRSFHAARHPKQRTFAAVGLVSVVVLLLAGFFEFNFGDSEVLMIFLFLVSAPYAVRQDSTLASGESSVNFGG
jgi:putative inorganic carbon (hco3(-)) transporter